MTTSELSAFATARETVARLGELAQQDWWVGYVRWTDYCRQFPKEPDKPVRLRPKRLDLAPARRTPCTP